MNLQILRKPSMWLSKWAEFATLRTGPSKRLPRLVRPYQFKQPAPQYGQYLKHAHNHITPVVAAMDR